MLVGSRTPSGRVRDRRGVMGGADSEVTAGTPVIVFESAYFNPLSVRRTSKKLGLKTEASMRFERGSDPRLPTTAMERACALARGHRAPARRAGIAVDRHPDACTEPMVAVAASREDRADCSARSFRMRMRGASSRRSASEAAAPDAGPLDRGSGAGWDVTVPTRRVSTCAREVDLIEEVARH